MAGIPNTIAVILLFAAAFFACILWATSRHADMHHSEEQDVGKPGKDS
jgi:hypothetical protein